MKKILGVIVLGLLLSGNAYAKILNIFCLIDTSELKKSKLDKVEYKRFAGKVIKFKINFDENLVYDVSEDSQMSVITGINQGFLNFIKTGDGIKYTNEQEMRGDKGKTIKYSYNNSISMRENSRTGRLSSRINQSGMSLKRYNFSIPCRWYDYTDGEKIIASRGLTAITKPKKVMKGGKGSTESGVVVPKKETKDNKNDIVNLENYAANNTDSLLYLYKAKLFKNNASNYVFLKNRNYLKFERGQQLTFEDIKELNEKHFFGLPLHNSSDRDRLKKLKKEYLSKKKAIKEVG